MVAQLPNDKRSERYTMNGGGYCDFCGQKHIEAWPGNYNNVIICSGCVNAMADTQRNNASSTVIKTNPNDPKKHYVLD